MTGRRVTAATLIVAVPAAAALLLVLDRSPDPTPAPERGPSAQSPQQASPVAPARARPRAGGTVGAHVLRRVQLRERPGGRVVQTLGRRTGYDSKRVLAVVARRPGWLGVLSDHMPNSRAGWIPAAAATLRFEPYTLHVDLSEREIVVRRGRHAVRRIAVAVGRAGSRTPIGRFAITDALPMAHLRSAYGCCALALTGRQPNLPQGWSGGDRLAIHGTESKATIGTPATAGCLRASNRDMRWLMARSLLGATVRIRA